MTPLHRYEKTAKQGRAQNVYNTQQKDKKQIQWADKPSKNFQDKLYLNPTQNSLTLGPFHCLYNQWISNKSF